MNDIEMEPMKYYRYHGLGNDYLVMNPGEIGRDLTNAEIERICHRNYGVGSDGILWGPVKTDKAEFKLRIFNPDASEAEKSGNGLRIFARYLFDQGLVSDRSFTIDTLGGIVTARVFGNGQMIQVDMGHVSFNSKDIPVKGDEREVLREMMTLKGKDYTFSAATVGNPHCVFLLDEISETLARELGPLVENDARFPNRTNVQFMKVLDRNNIQIEIWERGAGYTLASGSSSSAAASVAFKLGQVNSDITVHMPGGTLSINISEDFFIRMTGPVTRVADGEIDPEIFTYPLKS
jgi:diaminopimelate epimerase